MLQFEAKWRVEMGHIQVSRVNHKSARLQTTFETQPKLYRALMRAFGVDFGFGALWKLMQDSLVFVGPLVLKGLVQFMSDPTLPTSRGFVFCGRILTSHSLCRCSVGLAAALFVASVLQSLFLHKYFYQMYRVSLRVRAALVVVRAIFAFARSCSHHAFVRRRS